MMTPKSAQRTTTEKQARLLLSGEKQERSTPRSTGDRQPTVLLVRQGTTDQKQAKEPRLTALLGSIALQESRSQQRVQSKHTEALLEPLLLVLELLAKLDIFAMLRESDLFRNSADRLDTIALQGRSLQKDAQPGRIGTLSAQLQHPIADNVREGSTAQKERSSRSYDQQGNTDLQGRRQLLHALLENIVLLKHRLHSAALRHTIALKVSKSMLNEQTGLTAHKTLHLRRFVQAVHSEMEIRTITTQLLLESSETQAHTRRLHSPDIVSLVRRAMCA